MIEAVLVTKPSQSTTVLSTKGQVILPKAIRQQRRWDAGVRLIVEDTPDGVLLKPASHFAPTESKDVFGSLAYSGAPRSIEEMNAAISAEARRRHARD
jgi:AbrB family looped-hinge helix DNA binding protein